jgi:hypothetical protein
MNTAISSLMTHDNMIYKDAFIGMAVDIYLHNIGEIRARRSDNGISGLL